MSNYVHSQNSSIMIGRNQVHIWLPWNISPLVGVADLACIFGHLTDCYLGPETECYYSAQVGKQADSKKEWVQLHCLVSE